MLQDPRVNASVPPVMQIPKRKTLPTLGEVTKDVKVKDEENMQEKEELSMITEWKWEAQIESGQRDEIVLAYICATFHSWLGDSNAVFLQR